MQSDPTDFPRRLLFWWSPRHPAPSSRQTSRQRELMPHTNSFAVRRAVVVLLIATLGCGSDLLLPPADDGVQIVAITKLLGDEQIGPVGEPLGDPLMVEVVTGSQEPAAGVEVTFELSDPAAGTVSPTVTTTNTQGQAVANWTLGITPGSYVVVARLTGVEEGDSTGDDKVAEFHASARAGPPDTLAPQIPLAQPGARGQPVMDRPRVRVVDRFGNPVPDVPVAWQVTAGEGWVASPITATDAQGSASVDWTLGNRIGVQKLTAAIESATGSPVIFTARVLF
jgi:hypothetical protein